MDLRCSTWQVLLGAIVYVVACLSANKRRLHYVRAVSMMRSSASLPYVPIGTIVGVPLQDTAV